MINNKKTTQTVHPTHHLDTHLTVKIGTSTFLSIFAILVVSARNLPCIMEKWTVFFTILRSQARTSSLEMASDIFTIFVWMKVLAPLRWVS
jgi:hypothetical protein